MAEDKGLFGKIYEDVTAPIKGAYQASLDARDQRMYDYVMAGASRGEIDPETGGATTPADVQKWQEIKSKIENKASDVNITPVNPSDNQIAPEMQQIDQAGIVPASYTQAAGQVSGMPVEAQATTQTPLQKIDDELATQYANEAIAISEAAKQGQKQAIAESSYYKTLEDQSLQYQKDREERQKRLDSLTNQFQADIDTLSNEIQNTKFTDYWADKSTGQKIMAAIAVGLGGYGAGITGGQNQALGIINTAMQNDLNRQKEVLAGKKAAKDVKTENYRMLLDRYKTEDAADAAALAFMTQQAELKLKGIAASTMSEKVKTDAAQMISKLQQQRLILQRQSAVEAAKFEAERKDKLKPTTVAAFGQFAATKEGAAKVNEMASSFYQIEGGIDKLNDLAENGSRLSLKDRANANVVITTLTGALRIPITGPGAFTEKEQKMIREVIGEPTKLLSLNPIVKAKLKALKSYAKDQLFSVAESEGLDVSTFESINAQRKRGRKKSTINFQEIE